MPHFKEQGLTPTCLINLAAESISLPIVLFSWQQSGCKANNQLDPTRITDTHLIEFFARRSIPFHKLRALVSAFACKCHVNVPPGFCLFERWDWHVKDAVSGGTTFGMIYWFGASTPFLKGVCAVLRFEDRLHDKRPLI